MPILKAIAGHTSACGIKRYLEKDGRALAQDFYNLSWDERTMAGYDESSKSGIRWDAEMDEKRAEHGHDREWRGLRARTFYHYVLSPDPQDSIDLAALRELAGAWALREFGDYQIAITYHDDNEQRIPHAHIVVNCTNLATGYKLHIDAPEAYNAELQDMARERGLRGLSNERKADTGIEALAARGQNRDGKNSVTDRQGHLKHPRTRQATYIGHAEQGITEAGGWSWVADIRGRVGIAKTLAKSEAEFMGLLDKLEVDVTDNSERARRDDWIFSLRDEPSKKVSGERLGMSYGKQQLQRRFARHSAYRPTEASCSVLLARVEEAIELNDLAALDELSSALDTCSRFGIRSLADFDARLAGKGAAASPDAQTALAQARDFMAENRLLPRRVTGTRASSRHTDGDAGAAQAKRRSPDDAQARRQQMALQLERERQRRRDR